MCDINVVPLPEHHIFLWGIYVLTLSYHFD